VDPSCASSWSQAPAAVIGCIGLPSARRFDIVLGCQTGAPKEDENKAEWSFSYGQRLSFAETRFVCVFNNFACLSPRQNFRDQNLILA
jgi:hypothetical protein